MAATLEDIRVVQISPSGFQLQIKYKGGTNAEYWYWLITESATVPTAATIKSEGSNFNGANFAYQYASFGTALPAFNDTFRTVLPTANVTLNKDYYFHAVLETSTDVFTPVLTTKFNIDPANFQGNIETFESAFPAQKDRPDISLDKILLLYNTAGITDGSNTDEDICDDYIDFYQLTSHKIGVDCTVAANFDPATIWLSWMKGVADYIEANDIEAVFVSPNFSFWLPYPTPIENDDALSTDQQWSSGCAAQIAGSIPLVKKYLDNISSTDYRDFDVDVLVSDIIAYDATTPANSISIEDMISYDDPRTVGGTQWGLGGTIGSKYTVDFHTSIGTRLYLENPPAPGSYATYGSPESNAYKKIGARPILDTIATLRSEDRLDRLPNGRLGIGAVTGTGDYGAATGQYTNSPSMTRAQFNTMLEKSWAVRGNIETHKGKDVWCAPIYRSLQDVGPHLGMIPHRMHRELGFTNLHTIANVQGGGIWPDTQLAMQYVAERVGDTFFDTNYGYTPDVQWPDSTGTGVTIYQMPGTGGDYDDRSSGAGVDFTAYNSHQFPLPVWMWFGGGLENTDKSGTGHFFNSGNGFTVEDGAMYHSATSFGMFLGRWFLLEGGCCAVGSLRFELETDSKSIRTNNEIEMNHHTTDEIDTSVQQQENILRGHSAAWAQLFKNVGRVATAGYCKSEEVAGDPLYSPFYLERFKQNKATTMYYTTNGHPEVWQSDTGDKCWLLGTFYQYFGDKGSYFNIGSFGGQKERNNGQAFTASGSCVFSNSASTITDSGIGDVWKVGDRIAITGTSSNNITVTVKTSASGVITVNETLTNETSSATLTQQYNANTQASAGFTAYLATANPPGQSDDTTTRGGKSLYQSGQPLAAGVALTGSYFAGGGAFAAFATSGDTGFFMVLADATSALSGENWPYGDVYINTTADTHTTATVVGTRRIQKTDFEVGRSINLFGVLCTLFAVPDAVQGTTDAIEFLPGSASGQSEWRQSVNSTQNVMVSIEDFIVDGFGGAGVSAIISDQIISQ